MKSYYCAPVLSRRPTRLASNLALALVLAQGVARAAGPETDFEANFATPPNSADWRHIGDPAAFAWLADYTALKVTWDSSKTNSFFLHPLGTVLTASDDFSLSFRLQMRDITPGVDPAKPYTFQIALGFLNTAEALRTNYFRGSGVNATTGPRSVVEWDYFPDTGFGATVAPVVFATNNAVRASFTFPFELEHSRVYDVNLSYTAVDRTLRTTMLVGGEPTQAFKEVVLPAAPTFDFRLDALGIFSFSDAGQQAGYEGSVLAHGLVHSISARFPAPLKLPLDPATPKSIRFWARKGWRYDLERSPDLKGWEKAGSLQAELDGDALIVDESATGASWFYRVQASLP